MQTAQHLMPVPFDEDTVVLVSKPTNAATQCMPATKKVRRKVSDAGFSL